MAGAQPSVKVWIGWDPREMVAWNVAAHSLQAGCAHTGDVRRLAISELHWKGLYRRPTQCNETGHPVLDEISDAPMSSEHAISRFFVPLLCQYDGWALFMDGDVLVRGDIRELFALADEHYAVQVVQHPPLLTDGTKKDGAIQQAYPRKNWSSVVLWNCGHPANRALTEDVLNTWPGRDLHAFKWLDDNLIGSLGSTWNHLVRVSAPCPDPKIVHYTLGLPTLPEHKSDPFADEWRAQAKMCGYDMERQKEGV